MVEAGLGAVHRQEAMEAFDRAFRLGPSKEKKFGQVLPVDRPASRAQLAATQDTGLDAAQLRQLASVSVHVPADLKVHERLAKYHVAARLRDVQAGKVDWATAEAMAIGSLLHQGELSFLNRQCELHWSN